MHRDLKPQNLLLHPPPSLPSSELFSVTFDIFRKRSSSSSSSSGSSNSSTTYPACVLSHPLFAHPLAMAVLPQLPILKLADFGFARHLPSPTSMVETLCGSPLYMAPEILRYEKYDAKADLWSVGVVFYESLFGRAPFRAQNHIELLQKIDKAKDRLSFPKICLLPPNNTATTPLEDLRLPSIEMDFLGKLLKHRPHDRISLDLFFQHPLCVEAGKLVNAVTQFRQRQLQQEQSSLVKNKSAESSAPINIPGPMSVAQRLQDEKTAPPRPLSMPVLVSRGASSSSSSSTSSGSVVGSLALNKTSSPTARATTTDAMSGPHPNVFGQPSSLPSKPSSIQPPLEHPFRLDDDGEDGNSNSFDKDYIVIYKEAVQVNALTDQLALYSKIDPTSHSSTSSTSSASTSSFTSTSRLKDSSSNVPPFAPRRQSTASFVPLASPTLSLGAAVPARTSPTQHPHAPAKSFLKRVKAFLNPSMVSFFTRIQSPHLLPTFVTPKTADPAIRGLVSQLQSYARKAWALQHSFQQHPACAVLALQILADGMHKVQAFMDIHTFPPHEWAHLVEVVEYLRQAYNKTIDQDVTPLQEVSGEPLYLIFRKAVEIAHAAITSGDRLGLHTSLHLFEALLLADEGGGGGGGGGLREDSGGGGGGLDEDALATVSYYLTQISNRLVSEHEQENRNNIAGGVS